jgi:hypothetical protein
MKTRSHIVALFAGLLLLTACQTTQEYLATFHGMDKGYLIGRMGQPDAKEADGRGGEIWIYEEKQISATSATETETIEKGTAVENKETTTKKKQLIVPTQRVRLVVKSFYIDTNGVIYDTAHGSRYLQR